MASPSVYSLWLIAGGRTYLSGRRPSWSKLNRGRNFVHGVTHHVPSVRRTDARTRLELNRCVESRGRTRIANCCAGP